MANGICFGAGGLENVVVSKGACHDPTRLFDVGYYDRNGSSDR